MLFTKSRILVISQILSIIFIILTGQLIPKNPLLFVLFLIGIILWAWAFFEMRVNKINMSPIPAKKSKLVTSGPYKYIRHPMYAALLLIFFPLIFDLFTVERLVLGVILLATLLVKLLYEEELLKKRFKTYKAYQSKTSRLIPTIY